MGLCGHLLFVQFVVFTVTFVVFPGTTNRPPLSFISQSEWLNLFYVALFNGCDTLARTFGGFKSLFLPKAVILALTYGRSLFIATFLLSVFKVSTPFTQDWFKIINMTLFGLSNGFLATQAAVMAPMEAKEDKREQVGIFVSFYLCFGIMVGSIIAIPMQMVVA